MDQEFAWGLAARLEYTKDKGTGPIVLVGEGLVTRGEGLRTDSTTWEWDRNRGLWTGEIRRGGRGD